MVNRLPISTPLINYKQMADKNFEKNRYLNFSVFHSRFNNYELRIIYDLLSMTEKYRHLHKGALFFVPMYFILSVISSNSANRKLSKKIKYMLRWNGIKQ